MEMDFSSQNPATSNALSLAARDNDVNNVERLLKTFNPNCVDNRGWTCLHEAAYYDSYESMMLILNNPLTRGLAETHEGHTALYLACKNGCSLKTIKALLESVDDIANYGSTEGVTPLHIGSVQGNVELIELLLQYGAMLNVQDFDGDTPLHDAALGGQHDALVALLYAGADAEIINIPSGFSAFHLACYKGYLPNVESLYPFISDINNSTDSGDTPLHYALQGGDDDIVFFLLEHGADPNIKNKCGEMALDIALESNPAIFKKLLSITDKKKINKHIIANACKPHKFQFDVLEVLLTSDLGPEYFNVVNPFNTLINQSCLSPSTYLTHAPLNNYLSICGYIYQKSPEKFREFFYLFLMKGVNTNPLHATECPPLVFAHYVHHTDHLLNSSFNEVFKILVDMGCDVDYCSMGKHLRDDICISDAFHTAMDIYPYSTPLMMQYSLYNEPNKFLYYAYQENLIVFVPIEIHNKLLEMIDKSFSDIPAECIDFHVPCLKHLCRYTIRRFLRNRNVYKNNIKIEYTTSTFLNLINSLPIPMKIKHYLRYIED